MAIRVKRGVRYSLAAAQLRLSKRATVILRYHSVAPPGQAFYVSPNICLDPSTFEAHVRLLTSRYDVIGLDEAMRRLEHARPKGSRPGVVVTFDDGYRDNHDYALPILRKYGAPATVYVVAGTVSPAPAVWTVRLMQLFAGDLTPSGGCPVPVEVDLSGPEETRMSIRRLTQWLRGLSAGEREESLSELSAWLGRTDASGSGVMMSADELRAMLKAGVTIGAHTCTHPLLTAVPPDEAEREISESRRILERIVGAPVVHFSYPNPGAGLHENPAVRAMVRKAGYRTATTSQSGLVREGSDPFALRRFGVNSGEQGRQLIGILGAS